MPGRDDNVIPFPVRGAFAEAAETSAGSGSTGSGSAFPSTREPQLRPVRLERVTYVVRVDVDHAKPPIWRRLRLVSDLTLDRLHVVLQRAFGWQDDHPHHFVMGPGPGEFWTDAFAHERQVRLDEVLTEPGDLLTYVYDFGDNWDHTIKLVAVEPADDVPARCVAGRRACPPEDVGGIDSYNDLIVHLAAPSEESEHRFQEIELWLPTGFDPGAFHLAETDRAVRDAAARD